MTTTLYDARDNVVKVTRPGGTDAATDKLSLVTTTSKYNAFGQPVLVIEGDGATANGLPGGPSIARVTESKYDAGGRLWWQQTRGAASGSTSRTTELRYDTLDRVVRQIGTATAGVQGAAAPPPRVSYFGYDVYDNKITVVDPLGRRTEVRYDELDRPFETVEVAPRRDAPLGIGDRFTAGLGAWSLFGAWDAASRVTARRYDAADHVVWEAAPRNFGPVAPTDKSAWKQALVTAHAYDALGRKVVTVVGTNATDGKGGDLDKLGHQRPVFQWNYDSGGRVTFALSPGGDPTKADQSAAAVKYEYAPGTDQVVRIDEGVFAYGKAAAAGFASLRYETKAYDGMGNLSRHEVALGHPLGYPPRLTTYGHDPLGRVAVAKEYAGNPTADNKTGYFLATVRLYNADGTVREEVRQPSDTYTSDYGSPRATIYDRDALGRVTYQWSGAEVQSAWFYEVGGSRTLSVVPQTVARWVDTASYGSKAVSAGVAFEYDTFDNAVTVTNAFDVQSKAVYDGFGQKSAFAEAAVVPALLPTHVQSLAHTAGTTSWTYDAGGRVVSVKAPRTAWKADGSPELAITETTFGYDAYDHQTRVTEAVGTAVERSTVSVYNAEGLRTLVTRGASDKAVVLLGGKEYQYAAPITTKFEYDGYGRESVVYDGHGVDWGFAQPWQRKSYSAAGQVIQVNTNVTPAQAKAPTVSVARYEYDSLGRQVAVWQGESETGDRSQARASRVTYDHHNNVIWQLDANGVEHSFLYDMLGRKAHAITGNPSATTGAGTPHALPNATYVALDTVTRYNAFGEAVETITPTAARGGWRFSQSYNRLGLVEVVKPHGDNAHIITTTYDATGSKRKVHEQVDRLYYPDAKNQEKVATSTYGSDTRYEYDPAGRLVAVQYPNGNRAGSWYGSGGEVTVSRTQGGDEIFYSYDALGRTETEFRRARGTTTVGEVWVFRQDANDNPTVSYQVHPGTGAWVRWPTLANSYHPVVLNKAALADAEPGTATVHVYDPLGRLAETHNPTPELAKATYQYDAAGRVVRIEGVPNTGDLRHKGYGSLREFGYDLAGRLQFSRLTAATDPDGTYTKAKQAVTASWTYWPAVGYSTDQVKSVTVAETTAGVANRTVVGEFYYDNHGREVGRVWKTPGYDVNPDDSNRHGTVRELISTEYRPEDGLVRVEHRSGYGSKGYNLITIKERPYVDPATVSKYDIWGEVRNTYHYDNFGRVNQTSTSVYSGITTTDGPVRVLDPKGSPVYRTEADAKQPQRPRYVNGYFLTLDPYSEATTKLEKGLYADVLGMYAPGELRYQEFRYDPAAQLTRLEEQYKRASGTAPDGTSFDTHVYDFRYDAARRLRQWNHTINGAAASAGHFAYLEPAGTISQFASTHYLYAPDGSVLAAIGIDRWDAGGTPLLEAGVELYTTDRQGSVLQVVKSTGASVGRYRYEGFKPVTVQEPAVARGQPGGARSELMLTVGSQPLLAPQKLLLSGRGQWSSTVLDTVLNGSRSPVANPYPVMGAYLVNVAGGYRDPALRDIMEGDEEERAGRMTGWITRESIRVREAGGSADDADAVILGRLMEASSQRMQNRIGGWEKDMTAWARANKDLPYGVGTSDYVGRSVLAGLAETFTGVGKLNAGVHANEFDVMATQVEERLGINGGPSADTRFNVFWGSAFDNMPLYRLADEHGTAMGPINAMMRERRNAERQALDGVNFHRGEESAAGLENLFLTAVTSYIPGFGAAAGRAGGIAAKAVAMNVAKSGWAKAGGTLGKEGFRNLARGGWRAGEQVAEKALFTNAARGSWRAGEGALARMPSNRAAGSWLPNCFPAGTLVHTEGGLRAIEGVEAGERVWAVDQATGGWKLCEVRERFERMNDGPMVTLAVGGEAFRCTAGHVVWVASGDGLESRPVPDHALARESVDGPAGRWVLARDVRAGDAMVLRTHAFPVAVERVAVDDSSEAVYNLRLAGCPTFAVGVGGLLVHNMSILRGEAADEVAGLLSRQGIQNVKSRRMNLLKTEEHHIATIRGTHPGNRWAEVFEYMFDGAWISMHSSINRVVVQGHQGPHGLYNWGVFSRLRLATRQHEWGTREYRRAFQAELSRLRGEVRKGEGLGALIRVRVPRNGLEQTLDREMSQQAAMQIGLPGL